MSERMRIMRSKELPKELRDRIVARHRSGQGYEIILYRKIIILSFMQSSY